MDNSLLNILFLCVVGSTAGLIGGVIFLIKKAWARTLCAYAVPFAAGVLLSVSILHLIPEAAQEIKEDAYGWVLGAFIVSFFFEQYFTRLHHHEERRHTTKTSIPLIIVGDTIHNFIDGVAIASAYLIDPSFGLIVALATFLHETPHEIGDFGVLMSFGWTRKKTLIANFLSCLSTFPGAVFTFFVATKIQNVIGILLAVSAGMFLYLGASDFLPEFADGSESKIKAHKELFVFIFGVLIIYSLRLVLP